MKKEDLKIAVFSSYDKIGGAAISCYNCVKMLRDDGYNAVEIVRYKTGNDDFVYPVIVNRHISYFKRAINKFFPQKPKRTLREDTDPEYRFFDDENNSDDLCTIEEIENSLPFIPNIIFVGHSFNLVNTSMLVHFHKRWNAHIYMTCVDVNAYTGGCHVHWECDGYTTGCSNCPAVLVKNRKLEVTEIFDKKRRNIQEGNIGIRFSNNWQRRELQKSLIFKDRPLLLLGQNTDTDLYNPFNRDIAKRVFGIPDSSKTIMSGATFLNDKRKGLKYFCESMQYLYSILSPEERSTVVLLIVGKNKNEVKDILKKLPEFKVKIIDFITDTRLLSLVYQATDIYVGTSQEDAGPMMVSDSLACGTPIVGFKTGFIDDEEIIIDGMTGYRVEMNNTIQLAERVRDVLMLSDDNFYTMSENCRNIALNKLSKHKTLTRYRALFEEL